MRIEKHQFWNPRIGKLSTVIVKNFGELRYINEDGISQDIDELAEESDGEGRFDPASANIFFLLRNKLSGLDSLVLYLYYFEEWSQERIARFFGCSQTFVFTCLERTKKIVQADLECRKLWEEMVGKEEIEIGFDE